MRRRLLWCVTVGAAALACVGARAANLEAGRQKAEPCLACHGADGVSKIAGVPSLAGQPDGFLQWELVFFRNNRRHNAIMGPIAANLTDTEIRNLGAFIASLPPPATPPAPPDDQPSLTASGATLVKQGRCAACHGDDFTGLQAAARLAGQREEYLVTALKGFRSGERPSTGVAAMTDVANGLTDAQITAMAHYLARVR